MTDQHRRLGSKLQVLSLDGSVLAQDEVRLSHCLQRQPKTGLQLLHRVQELYQMEFDSSK